MEERRHVARALHGCVRPAHRRDGHPKDVAGFLARIEGASMANRLRSILSNCFTWACQATQSYLEINPVRLIEEKRRKERSDNDTQRRLARRRSAAGVERAA